MLQLIQLLQLIQTSLDMHELVRARGVPAMGGVRKHRVVGNETEAEQVGLREKGKRVGSTMPVSPFSVECHALLGQRACRGKASLAERYLPGDGVRRRNPLLEAHLQGKRQAFLQQRAHPRLVRLGNKEYLCQLGE